MNPPDEPGERRGLLPRFTLKHANTFLLADALGDIQGKDDGLFTNDTRMLSHLELAVAGRPPSLLGAAISQDDTVFTANLTNRPLPALGERSIPQGVIHIERSRFLWEDRLYERIRFTNFSEYDTEVPFTLRFAADFVDIFDRYTGATEERINVRPWPDAPAGSTPHALAISPDSSRLYVALSDNNGFGLPDHLER